MNTQLTFIVSTDTRNYPFALPFMFFAAKHNPNCAIDLHLYKGCNVDVISSGISFLKSCFCFDANVKDNISLDITPQLYRFLVEPATQTAYAYCSDIDIMICEDILPFHVMKLKGETYCYDNEIRQYSDPSKMSGLHFCTQRWYSQTKAARQRLLSQKVLSNRGKTNCEKLLKKIAEDSHVVMHPAQDSECSFWNNRPVHGQHISLSRQPFNKQCSMKNILDSLYEKEFLNSIRDASFVKLMQLATKDTRDIFNKYLEYVSIKERF